MKPTDFKTWEDICASLDIDPIQAFAFAEHIAEKDRAAVVAFYKLTKLSEASYGPKQPDWTNTNEYKYWPYFDMDDENDPSGFGFSHSDFGNRGTATAVGSRLCYPTREMAEYAGTQFIDWYRELMVLPKISDHGKEEN
jgi:hypothetical protein